jgi:CxxC motif-containing protein (DUF1111 family)
MSYAARIVFIVTAFCVTNHLNAQTDPGPRGGAASAGGAYATLTPAERALFTQGLAAFQEIDSVSGTIAGEPGIGLGPTFNGNSCAMCHAQPSVGGSSPGLTSKQLPMANPQIALASLRGARNTVPSFISSSGPVREARFVTTGAGTATTRDGGVHGLFTIAGRSDAEGCTLEQPDFATALANHNVVFRIPGPVFGLGLVENTPDATLIANLAANQAAKLALGIGGRLNTSGNDGTVTKFGWKAQNKSLLIFAGEAYNVEQGVSNDLFPNERSAVTGCIYNPTPEDATKADASSDIAQFAMFMKLTAPPTPATSTASEQNGATLFSTVGCALCHTPALVSGKSPYTGLSNVTYQPFSDFALHRMGSTLADGIFQGAAGGDEFRTAPLWGIGQRLFFLHDGRTSDLLQAIQAHHSPDCANPGSGRNGRDANNTTCASEANAVIGRFNALTPAEQQDVLNFLRSL